MSFLKKPSASSFDPAPAGTHLAVCHRLIHLGTQRSQYQGKEREQEKIMIGWELASETMSNGQPVTVSQWYTLSMFEKATLRKHLEAWRGKAFTDKDFAGPPDGFNIKNILGKPCLLTVTHTERNGNVYANVTGIARLMKGMAAPPPPANPCLYLWLDEKGWEPNIFGMLSEGLQDVIRKSPEYVHLTTPAGKAEYGIDGRRLDDSEDPAAF